MPVKSSLIISRVKTRKCHFSSLPISATPRRLDFASRPEMSLEIPRGWGYEVRLACEAGNSWNSVGVDHRHCGRAGNIGDHLRASEGLQWSLRQRCNCHCLEPVQRTTRTVTTSDTGEFVAPNSAFLRESRADKQCPADCQGYAEAGDRRKSKGKWLETKDGI
jgi:hypothetical protein